MDFISQWMTSIIIYLLYLLYYLLYLLSHGFIEIQKDKLKC